MAANYPRGILYKETLATTAETDLFTFKASRHFKSGFLGFLTSASVGGTFKVYYIDQDDVEWELASQAVTANMLTLIEADYPLPVGKFTFTPSAATSSVVKAELFGK